MTNKNFNFIRQIGLVCAIGSIIAVCISAYLAKDYTKLYPMGLPILLLLILGRKMPEA